MSPSIYRLYVDIFKHKIKAKWKTRKGENYFMIYSSQENGINHFYLLVETKNG